MAAMAILAFSLVATACFQIRFVKLEPKSLLPGAEGTVKVELYPMSLLESTLGYTFLLIGYESADMTLTGMSNFDLNANFGGPHGRTADATLRNFLRTGDNCAAQGISASEVTGLSWVAYRTTVKVNSGAGTLGQKNLIKIDFTRTPASANNGRGDYVVFSGVWTDGDNNGTIVLAEVQCTGMVFSSFPFRAP
jgi:hypothetical protein